MQKNKSIVESYVEGLCGFELYFKNKLSEADTGPDDDAPEAAPADGPVDGMPAETAEVVSLDSFRKSPS